MVKVFSIDEVFAEISDHGWDTLKISSGGLIRLFSMRWGVGVDR